MKKLTYYKEDLSDKNQFFQNNGKIDTMKDFDKLYKKIKKGYAYRGIFDATYKLYTSSQRDWLEGQLNSRQRIEGKRGKKFRRYTTFLDQLVKAIKKEKDLMFFLTGDAVDFNILALLQHFEYPSPLLDFSYDIKTSLFFMLDKIKDGEEGYCSLYYFNLQDLRMGKCTIEDLHSDAIKSYTDVVENFLKQNPQTQMNFVSELETFKNLPYKKYFKDKINFITLKGGVDYPTICEDNRLGVKYTYEITNPRMNEQKGLFVLSTSVDKPLEELIKANGYCSIHCANINKKLATKIKKKYLGGINKNDLYFPNIGSKYIYGKLQEMKNRRVI